MNARLHPEGLCGHLDGGPFGRGISLIFFLRSFTFSHFYVQLSLEVAGAVVVVQVLGWLLVWAPGGG